MSLYASIPQISRTLGQVRRWLDKAKAYAEQKKFDPEVLLSARLAPDQWALARQLEILALQPHRLAALIRGLEAPTFPESATSIDELGARLEASIELLSSLKKEEFEGADDRVIPLPFAPGKGLKASDFMTQFVFPNFYFHVVTTYSILRHNGVDIGKADYLGELSLQDL